MLKASAVVVALAASQVACASARAADPSDRRATRVLLETGAGAGAAALGWAGSGLLTFVACRALSRDERVEPCVATAQVGAAIGGWWAMAGGIVASGDALDGGGGLGWELVGQAGGTALAALAYAGLGSCIDSEELWWTTFVVLPLAGGIVGYELSARGRSEGAPPLVVGPLLVRF
ncbi:MAG: hypothetical protein U1F43_08590 [Myxococcota bacterium]